MVLLELEPRVLDEMLERCTRGRPLEVCGLLGGRDRAAFAHYPVANVADDPARRFVMDPEGQLRAMQAMEERDEELVAIYHSHPATSPVPSKADIEQAFYPDAFYIIVGTSTRTPQLRVYRLNALTKSAVEVRWRTLFHPGRTTARRSR